MTTTSMTNDRRRAVYLAQTGRATLTAAQAKRVRQRQWREDAESIQAHQSWREFAANVRRINRARRARVRELFGRAA